MRFGLFLLTANFNDCIWILDIGDPYHIGKHLGVSGEKSRNNIDVEGHVNSYVY